MKVLGQFENLISASERVKIVVPVALLLTLTLLVLPALYKMFSRTTVSACRQMMNSIPRS